MKVAVVLNGDEPGGDDLKLLDACDAIVCADGAAQALLKAAHPPSVIVGDLDSLGPEAYKWADALDVPLERHPKDKDETDGELALEKAFTLGATSIVILGGHGGRSAMFLANLKLLRRCLDKGLDAVMVGRGESLRYVGTGGELVLAGRAGATLNLVATEGDATVSLEGTSWDGKDIALPFRTAKGLSNRIEKDGAKVGVKKGVVLVVVERKRKEYTAI
ncbi:MAG TPA: thiamine diphosphokinase [Candidatus Thermoplasmatota archaeon]|nr:thiamine diphosphokinase [Candidatus Thermoplasmatota archaeon]